jgi:hypothetical protein
VNGDVFQGSGEGVARFGEDGWVGGDLQVAFFGVATVVEAYAEDDVCCW